MARSPITTGSSATTGSATGTLSFVRTPLAAHIPAELEALALRANGRLTDQDKARGIDLLVDAYCDIIDTTLITLLDDIGRQYDHKSLQDARRIADDVKDKARHYVGWAGGRIATRRLPPVIRHFQGLVHPSSAGATHSHQLQMPISPALAQRGADIIVTLQDGTAANLDEGITLLNRIVEELMVPLATEPKNLLNFNFVISKPLDGAIAMIRALIQRMLMRFGQQITPPLYPLIGTHLSTFLISPRLISPPPTR
ncbi:MAG: hypothetical protein LAT61_08865 [Alcanivorax sp.]|nr:hypothetical protein [Alcanivorax sp.]